MTLVSCGELVTLLKPVKGEEEVQHPQRQVCNL